MASIRQLLESAETDRTQTVCVGLGERAYDIRIAEGILDRIGPEAKHLFRAGAPAVVVANDQLDREHYYGRRVQSSLKDAGVEAHLCIVPEGEGAKTLGTVSQILDFMVERRLPRQAVLFAVGGGVIGDMGGFAAAIYLRGIPYVQVPTSLLAMVDSSVGGKTGVNHPKGKNLIGAFYQPCLVAADLAALATLPRKEFRAGLAEVIKHGVIRDAELFEVLEERIDELLARDARLLAAVIRRNCEIKADVVAADEREEGLRAILNFGHTVGHAVETLASAAGMVHGEAVAIGMIGASLIAVKMGLWTGDEHGRLCALLERAGLPTRIPALAPEAILDRMLHDKKIVGKTLRFVLPVRMGAVEIRGDVPADLLAETIKDLR